ncbi:hypothetical protein RFI_37662 [Reticulomyxa filosa]|uniref:Uncharacterized protein n=1 Tax=Reticulomyxa filosa TaxID=46433 RepID=X6LEL1_RETFI|nr:hypothetical protein RFI_37662 [Reticulomyxa filosa]|eukprot:ETN99805.1 hypothetical protein RFI_37662 [Reticulomyxa filosa]
MMQSFESLFAVLDSESVLAEKDVLVSAAINGLFILDKYISVEIIAADNDNDVEIIRDAHVAQNNNEKKKSQHDFLFHDDADNNNNMLSNCKCAPSNKQIHVYIMYKYLLLLSFCMYVYVFKQLKKEKEQIEEEQAHQWQ